MSQATFAPTPHPVLPLPSPEEASALGYEKWAAAVSKREAIIRAEREDPLRNGWEPPIWTVCDYLLGFPWVDPIKAEQMRTALGFRRPVDVLMINGGNRGGKSEYAVKRCNRVMVWKRNARVWLFHTSNAMSVEYQQPLFWKYMPRELKKTIRSALAYVSYTFKYGFSDNRVVFTNGSDASFRNYEQEMTTIEGGEIDLAEADELIPPDWIETLELRIATRAGKILITFTPVKGYTPAVKMFHDGAAVVRESTAFLLPTDGMEPLVDHACQLEDCLKWADGERSQPPVPDGRAFETVPRIMRCVDEKRAVVFFHSSDNPFGNPRNLWELLKGKNRSFILERWYGKAQRLMSSRFAKFERKVHVVAPDEVPAVGTNYQLVDPGEARNYFMIWARVTRSATGRRKIFIYRQWPGPYPIPGIGVPGPWAYPSAGKIGGKDRQDGKPGPAQESFGWGFLAYKQEIARLEGWEDCDAPRRSGVSPEDWKAGWAAENGARESVLRRFIDSRPASKPLMENDRPVTILSKFADIGLHFEPTPGDEITEGVNMVNDLLDYEEDERVDEMNEPELYVSEDCPDVIFAMETWTGADGNKGACKDPADLVRYLALLDLKPLTAADYASEGGGHY